jgi:serine/threonine protein kinase
LIDSAGNASIIDFGLSFISGPPFTSSGVSNPGAGTIRWMAPERLYPEKWDKEQPISTFESDIYSLGMVIYEVCIIPLWLPHFFLAEQNLQIYSGNIPFEGSTNNMVVVFVLAGQRPSRPTRIPNDMWHLTEWCWHANTDLRPEIASIFEDLTHSPRLGIVPG